MLPQKKNKVILQAQRETEWKTDESAGGENSAVGFDKEL